MSALSRLLFLAVILRGAAQRVEGECDTEVSIRGGSVTFPGGGRVGSALQYRCPPGSYPFPAAQRTCRDGGRWSRMRVGRRIIHRASCKEFRCPRPVLEDGSLWPVGGPYAPGSEVAFQCADGYTLLGSPVRTCGSNGRWSGTNAICEDGTEHCRAPGVPPGGVKSGRRYGVGQWVSYRCSEGLILIGSETRSCQKDGEWTGAEPHCQHKYSTDLPDDVASYFATSFSNVLNLAQTETATETETETDRNAHTNASVGRSVTLEAGKELHVYLVLDASGSITESEFRSAVRAVITFADMISNFEVEAKYGVIAFASVPTILTDMSNADANDFESAIYNLRAVKFSDLKTEGNKGTNIKAALDEVLKMMIFQRRVREKEIDTWLAINHVIVLLTDGKSNTGGEPIRKMQQIRYFLEINKTREDHLDVYVLGLGPEADKETISKLASNKPNERHAFFLEKEQLVTVFNHMLRLTSVGDLCGFANASLEAINLTAPWHVEIHKQGDMNYRCSGSIVAKDWILTAAHCFERVSDQEPQRVSVRLGNRRSVKVSQFHRHPKYSLRSKVGDGIAEFYDYDAALVKLTNSLKFTADVRPVCLPCTWDTSRVLQMNSNHTGCSDHERNLLPPVGKISAKFVQRNTLKTAKIMAGAQERRECEESAKKASIYSNVTEVKSVVTERFLCSGGASIPIACKGDSGGPLYVQKKYRNIQVGVISWGVEDHCDRPSHADHARDFHISVFRIMPWLKEVMGDSVQFLAH
uniref:C3/C5 convertase n=1 Tax=Callorhinchus milii TaxID=7868 RepID=V9KIW5_CALMI